MTTTRPKPAPMPLHGRPVELPPDPLTGYSVAERMAIAVAGRASLLCLTCLIAAALFGWAAVEHSLGAVALGIAALLWGDWQEIRAAVKADVLGARLAVMLDRATKAELDANTAAADLQRVRAALADLQVTTSKRIDLYYRETATLRATIEEGLAEIRVRNAVIANRDGEIAELQRRLMRLDKIPEAILGEVTSAMQEGPINLYRIAGMFHGAHEEVTVYLESESNSQNEATRNAMIEAMAAAATLVISIDRDVKRAEP